MQDNATEGSELLPPHVAKFRRRIARGRYPECICSLEINDQLEPRWLLDRQVTWREPKGRVLAPPSSRLGATVWFSRLELTLHGSLALTLAADVVVLPLHTRH